MGGAQEGDAFFHQCVHVQAARPDRRLAGQFGERSNAAFQAADFIDDNLRGLFQKIPAASRAAHRQFFHRQTDGRKRILHFVRGLPRQRLPALETRDPHQPVAGAFQFGCHFIERAHRGADLLSGRFVHSVFQISGRHLSQRQIQLANRPAEAARPIDEKGEREYPDRGGEEDERVGKTPSKIAPRARSENGARAGIKSGNAVQMNARKRRRIDRKPQAATEQIVDAVAVHKDKPLGVRTLPKFAPRGGPRRFGGRVVESAGNGAAGRVAFQRLADLKIQLSPGRAKCPAGFVQLVIGRER